MFSLILLSALAAPASDLDAQAALALASASTRLPKPARQGLCGDSGCPCSKCGDYCSCSESGYPCGSAGCVCPASKVAKTWTGKDGRLWTWSEDEGGYWWAYRIRQNPVVIHPINNYQGWTGHHQQIPYQITQYQPVFHSGFSGSSCVGGSCSQR